MNIFKQEKINILETLLLSNATPILGTGFGINYPSWTVSGEMFAYLIFALICLSATPIRKRNLIIITLIACFLFMLFTKTYFYNFSWGVVRGLFCFLLGYGVTKSLSLTFELPKWIDLLILPVIFLLMYVLHQFDPNAAGKQLFALFAVPITFASIMIIMTRSQGYFNKLMEHTIFQFLGKISYSSYLNHALIITYIPWLVFHKMHWTSTPAHQWIILASCMIVLVGYSYLTYRVVERQGVSR